MLFPTHVSFIFSLVPVREQSTEAAKDVVKSKPYSPFQATNNKAEYALARVDDLLNWARKVRAWRYLSL